MIIRTKLQGKLGNRNLLGRTLLNKINQISPTSPKIHLESNSKTTIWITIKTANHFGLNASHLVSYNGNISFL